MSEKLCLVTGTSSGIGRVVAERLLEGGWQVVGVARREARLHDHAYHHVTLDLADLEALERYCHEDFARGFPADRYRRIGLVNNAGVLDPVLPLARLSAAGLQRAFTINTVAPLWLIGFFLGHCAHTPLRVVNVSSGAAHNPRAGWTAYCASKAALRMGGRVFGEEVGLPATMHPDAALWSYEPGAVDTEMQTHVRGIPAEDLPSVGRFVDLYERGQLIDPARPAREIAAFLEGDGAPPFGEARLGG